jgi:serine/threonine protein kinase
MYDHVVKPEVLMRRLEVGALLFPPPPPAPPRLPKLGPPSLHVLALLILGLQWLSLSLPIVCHAQDTYFSVSNFSTAAANLRLPMITFIGDAAASETGIQLTSTTTTTTSNSSSSRVGRALYQFPVRMSDPANNNVTASFTTFFTFSVVPSNVSSFGAGLAFLFVPGGAGGEGKAGEDDEQEGEAGTFLEALHHDLGDGGGQLGVFNVSDMRTCAHTFAVEFDTFADPQPIDDMNDNHVGIDLHNATSVVSADAANANITFKSGSLVNAWIDYSSHTQILQVRISSSADRPMVPIISETLDLPSVLSEWMYVGFAAASGRDTELHTIHAWTFSTSGLLNVQDHHPHRNTGIVAGMIVTGLLLLLLVCTLVFNLCSSSRRRSKAAVSFKRQDEFEAKNQYGLRCFQYKELGLATKWFDEKEKLGLGGIGNVYRGVLPDTGCLVAVKQVAPKEHPQKSGFDQNKFAAEVVAISQLQHRNLVQLQGWCQSDGKRFLVYEFMSNGSLDQALYNEKLHGPVLSWSHRYKIVSGLAVALHYLHEERFVHRDVKSSNILLDNNFNPKLGDFGLTRLMNYHNHPEATVVAGTFGYIAPEAIQSGKATDKTDVFSFGAVMLEVACGRRPLDTSWPEDQAILVDWVWNLHQNDNIMQAADPRLECAYDMQEMRTMLLVGLLCSHPDPSTRPSMGEVVQILNNEVGVPRIPTKKPVTSFDSDKIALTINELLSESFAHNFTSSTHFSSALPE